METKEHKLLGEVNKLFMKCGIKSLTMDDISRELGISKKTLYCHCTDKEDLLKKTLEQYFEEEMILEKEVKANSSDAIDELYKISRHVSERIKNMHPSILFDLKKYHPDAFRIFSEYKKTSVYKSVSENMKKGIKEGLYRSNLNIPIVARIYISKIDVLFDAEIFPPGEFNSSEVFIENLRYHIRGIASQKGIDYLVSHFKTNDKRNQIF